ncbi:MAG TPA: hypothetical protein VGF71_08135 [Caulobacteraceae bacterium]|jgi:hypothetical protein
MKQEAVRKARRRLKDANAALTCVSTSRDFRGVETAWGHFLRDLNGVFIALERGIEGPQNRQWRDFKKEIRNEDPLLAYLHHARDAEEHGIAPVVSSKPGGVTISAGAQFSMMLVPDEDEEIGFQMVPLPGPGIVFNQPEIRLVSVVDRNGQGYDPPAEHLGMPLLDGSPANVGSMALSYYDGLIREAGKLA